MNYFYYPMRHAFFFFVLTALSFLSPTLRGELIVSPLFGDNAVLQREMPVPIWGMASAGEKVSVQFAGQKKEATAEANGKWRVHLDPLTASQEPQELVIEAEGKTVRFSGILVGEVWLCSGQSNMVWPVKRANDAEKEIAAADHPLIRLFQVGFVASEAPLETVSGAWVPCHPSLVEEWPGVPYFFARELQRELGVPVGVVVSARGGTQIQSWISEEAFKPLPNYQKVLDRYQTVLGRYPAQMQAYEEKLAAYNAEEARAKAAKEKVSISPPRPPEGRNSRETPFGLYNGMIRPLIPLSMRGIIWYQGESDANNADTYEAMFKALITGWRKDWAREDLPFYFVQLPNYARSDNRDVWVPIREAQAGALKLPNTGMVVAIDIGDARQLHPPNKQDVGKRLALLALAHEYDQSISFRAPSYKRSVVEGSFIKVEFDGHGALSLKPGARTSFEVAGEDDIFYPASAKIIESGVEVTSEMVSKPVAVRYAWKNDPIVTLYGDNGLPVAPFRSEKSPEVSEKQR